MQERGRRFRAAGSAWWFRMSMQPQGKPPERERGGADGGQKVLRQHDRRDLIRDGWRDGGPGSPRRHLESSGLVWSSGSEVTSMIEASLATGVPRASHSLAHSNAAAGILGCRGCLACGTTACNGGELAGLVSGAAWMVGTADRAVPRVGRGGGVEAIGVPDSGDTWAVWKVQVG